MNSHEVLGTWASAICGECNGTVVEKYPPRFRSGEKEYWRIKIDDHILLLMRKGGMGTALGGTPEVLVKVAEQLGNNCRVGWRWMIWDLKRTLTKVFALRRTSARTTFSEPT